MRKKCSSDRGTQERSLRIYEIFEITRTIYWNSETECFFNLFLKVSQLQLEQLEFKLEKNEIQKPTEKVRTLFIFKLQFLFSICSYLC